MHGHDARMAQPGHDGRFLHEALDQMAPVAESFAQDLDRHARPAGAMCGCVDLRHSARPDQSFEMVIGMPERGVYLRCGRPPRAGRCFARRLAIRRRRDDDPPQPSAAGANLSPLPANGARSARNGTVELQSGRAEYLATAVRLPGVRLALVESAAIAIRRPRRRRRPPTALGLPVVPAAANRRPPVVPRGRSPVCRPDGA